MAAATVCAPGVRRSPLCFGWLLGAAVGAREGRLGEGVGGRRASAPLPGRQAGRQAHDDG